MANIFKSDEVYKAKLSSIDSELKIYPLRGLYVAGQRRYPEYKDYNINIVSIETSKAVIGDYYTSEHTVGDKTNNNDAYVTLCNITPYGTIDIDVYFNTEYDINNQINNNDAYITLCDISLYETMVIESYFTSEYGINNQINNNDAYITLCNMSVYGDKVIDECTEETNNAYTAYVELKGISTTNADISNYQ